MKVFFSVITLLVLLGMAVPGAGSAEVNVSIGIGLPALVFPGPPGMVVVPGSYVYYPPEVEVDIFFYHGYWYRPYGGGWYIANGYNGPWRTVSPKRVPRAVFNVPSGYRGVPPRHDRVSYPVVQRNWRTWEKERHWDNDGHQRRDHGGREHEERGRGHGRRD